MHLQRRSSWLRPVAWTCSFVLASPAPFHTFPNLASTTIFTFTCLSPLGRITPSPSVTEKSISQALLCISWSVPMRKMVNKAINGQSDLRLHSPLRCHTCTTSFFVFLSINISRRSPLSYRSLRTLTMRRRKQLSFSLAFSNPRNVSSFLVLPNLPQGNIVY